MRLIVSPALRSLLLVFFLNLFLICNALGRPLLVLEDRAGEVIDGDTIRLSDGQVVRYLGVDSPEVRKKVNGRWVYDPQPGSAEATRRNREWVEGKTLRLEFDPAARYDRHGRLLAYVFADGVFVNKALLQQGLARRYRGQSRSPYGRLLKDAEADAKQHKRGIWSKEQE